MGLNKVEYENAVNLTRKIKEKFSDEQIRELSVLNLGAGTCGSFVSIHTRSIPFEYLDNVEVFHPYYEVLAGIKFASYNTNNFNQDLVEFLQLDDKDERYTIRILHDYDLIIMVDVIEHLPKETAERLLQRLREARFVHKRTGYGRYPHLLLFVPIGDCPQDEYDGNSYQKHLSTWELDDFKDFEVEYHPELHGSFGAAWVWI